MPTEEEDQERRQKLAIEPTIPATDMRHGIADLSHERRPTDVDSGGGAPIWVIVALVAAVGVAFWWFTGKHAPAPATSPSAVAEPAKPAPTAAAAAPAARPTAKPAAKSAPSTPAAARPPAAAPATATPPSTAPAATAPAAHTATTAPATTEPETPAPPAHKVAHAHKRHKKPKTRAKEVKLPRLPVPPPSDP
jgi:hypothetical protein